MATEAAKFPHAATTTMPGDAVTKKGAFIFTKPCLSTEGKAKGCQRGLITVRASDGLHFCPGALTFPTGCPVYSSGAFRFASAMSNRILWANKNL